MAKARLFAENFLTAASMLTPSTTALGQISNPQKEGSGVGSIQVAGNFSGTSDIDYVVQIDGAGELGAATFRWSDDDGSTWDAAGVTTSASPITLNNGVTVTFAGGSGTDFALNDLWRFKAWLPYGRAKLLDLDRDTEYRSANVSAILTLAMDLGQAKTPLALIIGDHNFSSSAVIQIQGSSASDFSSLGVDEVVTWRSGSMLHYFTTASRLFRYWRLRVDNIGNSDGYYRLSTLYLGTYVDLAQSFALGDVRRRQRMAARERLISGRWSGGLNTVVMEFDVVWEYLSEADKDRLVTAFNTTNNTTTRTISPLYFNPDSDTPGDIFLCEWEEALEIITLADAPGRYRVGARLLEVARTV